MPTFTVTLKAGETIVLPSDAKITGVFADGNTTLSSSCTGDLPATDDYKCGVFYMNVDNDNDTNHPNDEGRTYFSKLIIKDLEFELDGLVNGVDEDYLNTFVPPQGLFTFTHINRFTITEAGDDKRRAVYVYFKVAEPFFNDLELQINAHRDDTRPSRQYYKPLTEDELAGVDDLDCEEYPF